MADVLTVTTGIPHIDTWDVPPDVQRTSIPRGRVLFDGFDTIPAKLAADDSLWTLNMVMPRNFIYRLTEARVVARSTGAAPFVDFSTQMLVSMSTDDRAEQEWFFGLLMPVSFDFNFGSETDHRVGLFTAQAEVMGRYSVPFDSSLGAARIAVSWADLSADATDAVRVDFRFVALMYDVEQARSWEFHAPAPVILI